MHDVRLKRVERNEILALIDQVGLNPLEFEWKEQDTEDWIDMDTIRFRCSVLSHKPTGYFCKFGGLRVEFSPGPDKRVEADEHRDVWNIKRNVAQLWLEELSKEVEAPDMWAALAHEKILPALAASPAIDNRHFTAQDERFIAAKLEEIKGYLMEARQFDHVEATTVEQEFEYLKQASKKFGRKDWLNLLLGGLVSLAITLALDPEKTRGLLRLAGTLLQSLWGSGQAYLE